MYVIQNTQHGGFVSKPGSASSYQAKLQHARTWPTREAAEREKCPGNERVVSIEEAMGVGR